MKIRLGTLRTYIKEGITFAQGLAGVEDTGEEPGEDDWQRDAEALAQKKPVQRFFGKKFSDDAVKLYRNLTIPIYVVPVWSYKQSGDPNEDERNDYIEDATVLTRYGISPEKAQELEKARASGAAIFVALTARLNKGSLPTPWMLVHAMFDSVGYAPLKDVWQQVYEIAGERYDSDDEFAREFTSALTMASARNNKIGVYTDLIAEILTQAVLTTKGFVYKPTGNVEVDDALKEVSKVVSHAREEFERVVAGQVVIIGAHLIN